MKNSQYEKSILLTLIAISAFFACSLIGLFGEFGKVISDFMVGFFGYTAYAVVFCTLIVCGILLFGGQVYVSARSALKYVGLLLLLVATLHVATSKQFFELSYFAYLKACFDSSATAGGMLFGIICYVPTKILSYVGALALFILAFLVSCFFALGKPRTESNNFRSKKIVYGSKNTATLTEFGKSEEKEKETEVGSSLFVGSISGKDSFVSRSKNSSSVINYEPIDSIFGSDLSGIGILEKGNKEEEFIEESVPAPVLEADVRKQAYDKLFNFQKTYTPKEEEADEEEYTPSPVKKYVPRATQYDGAERTTTFYPEEKKEDKVEENIDDTERDPIPKLNLAFDSNPYAFTNSYFNKEKEDEPKDYYSNNINSIFSSTPIDVAPIEDDSYGAKLSKVLSALNREPDYDEEVEEDNSIEYVEPFVETTNEEYDYEEDEIIDEPIKAVDNIDENKGKSASEILFSNPINPFADIVEDEEESEEEFMEATEAFVEEPKAPLAPVEIKKPERVVAPNRDFSEIENGNFNKAQPAKPKQETKSKVIPGQIELSDESVTIKRRPYVAPPLNLLSPDTTPSNLSLESHEETKANLEQVLANFRVEGQVTGVVTGPAFTRYEINLKPGVSVKNILRISDDIAMGLGGVKIRIEAPVPGKTCVGIEVPNKSRGTVSLRGVLEKSDFFTAKSPMTVCLGRNISGDNITCDLSDTPHLLVAGATGSGKSVCLNVILCSLLYKSSPEDLRLILVDPKRVELNSYNGLPHMLIKEAITEAPKVIRALDWLIAEMDSRYNLFSNCGVNSIKDYNAKVMASGEGKKLPYILIVIDEIGDLMLVAKNDIEDRIQRLAQLARAAGIHMIVATQRPSTDVITGVIKANLPSRIAFAVSSAPDSMTILSLGGAEKLLGKGDMLFSSRTAPDPVRIQCAFVPTAEVQAITQFVKEKNDAFFDENIEKAITSVPAEASGTSVNSDGDEEVDALFYDILKFAISTGTISVTMLQRKFRLGYSRAARVVDQMYERNFVSKQEGAKPREVLITQEQFNELFGEGVPDEID